MRRLLTARHGRFGAIGRCLVTDLCDLSLCFGRIGLGKSFLIKHCASKGKEFAFLGGHLPLQSMLYFLDQVFGEHKARRSDHREMPDFG
jgi:hypothetical protein